MNRVLLSVMLILMLSTGVKAQQISELRDVSAVDKLYNLSMIWKEVDYNFPFFSTEDRNNWNNTYREYLELITKTNNLYDFYRVLQRFTATLNDCNTRIVLPQAISSNLSYPFLQLKEFDGKIIVSNIGKKYVEQIPIGSEILEIDGMAVNRYLREEVGAYISASNEGVLNEKKLLMAFIGIEGTPVSVRVRKEDGTTSVVNLRRSWQSDSWSEFIWQTEVILHRWLDDDIVYIEMNRFHDPKIHEMFGYMLNRIRDCKGIVLDLRENNVGNINIAMDMLNHFTEAEKLPFPIIKSPKHIPMYRAFGTGAMWYGYPPNPEYINYGQRETWSEEDPIYFDNNPDKEKLIVPMVILIGEKTASPAEDFLFALTETRNDIIVAGANTSGRRGQALLSPLPQGGQLWISTSIDSRPDGTIISRKGIKPDVNVKQSYEDYLQEKDTVIEKGHQLLKNYLQNRQ